MNRAGLHGIDYSEHRLLGAAPEGAIAFAVGIFDQDSVDGTVQPRKVEGEAEIVAVVVGGFGPALADFRAPDKDAVAGGLQIKRLGLIITIRAPLVVSGTMKTSPSNPF